MLLCKTLITAGLLGIVQSLYFYTQLPDKVAIHFGSAGVPDSWADNVTNLVIWIFLYVSLVAVFMIIPLAIRKIPARLISLPNKEYWLSKEKRDSAIDQIGGFLNIFGTAFIVFFMMVGYFVFSANMSSPVVLNENAIWNVTVCLLSFTIVWLFMFYRKFKNV